MLHLYTEQSLVLDNIQFLIYNIVFHKAKLTQFGTGYNVVGASEHALHPHQLGPWTLTAVERKTEN